RAHRPLERDRLPRRCRHRRDLHAGRGRAGGRRPDGGGGDPVDPQLRTGGVDGSRFGLGPKGGPLHRAADPGVLRAAKGRPRGGQRRRGLPGAGGERRRGNRRGGRVGMSILALGVSYLRAPVELLERLSFADDDLPKAFRHALSADSVREAVILSTCNRVEVYAEVTSYHAGFLDLKRFLSESREADPDEFAEPLYSHYEDDAAEHLFSVAAGLDSMVLGEPQILAQVRAAFRPAHDEGAAGPMLSALLRGAIRTGRRVRAETAIGASPAAFVGVGAEVAAPFLGGLEGRSAVVIGAGGMASLAVAHLRRVGVGRLQVLNRSVERARTLASRAGADSAGLDLLDFSITCSALVVPSTGSLGPLGSRAVVRTANNAQAPQG